MKEIIYSSKKHKLQVEKFYEKFKLGEKEQLLVDLLQNEKVILHLNKFKPETTLLTNQGIINIIFEKFPEWSLKIIEKNNKIKDYSSEEKEKAIKILKYGDPLKFCLKALMKHHIGEQHILLLLLISGVSTGLRDRKMLIHVMGVGASGKGKTDSMENVGKMLSEFEPIISASPKNIFYKAENETLIDNGVLFFPENDIKDLEFQALERVLTDDKDITPKHETVINQSARSLEIKQINVMWRNSVGTSDDEDNQLNNRYYIFNVDESIEQDQSVFYHIKKNWNVTQHKDDSKLRIGKIITDLIKSEPVKVIIPYVMAIELTNMDDRRTLKKFLRLVTCVTYFYRFQRAKCDKYILSEMKDFEIANLIWEKINKYESSKLPEYETNIIEVVANCKEISITNLAKIMNKDISNLSKKIKDMEDKGLIYSERHTITTNSGVDRITKPIKFLYTNVKLTKKFRFGSDYFRFGSGFGSSCENVKMVVEDLKALNIKELEIFEKRFGIFDESETGSVLVEYLKKSFSIDSFSHFSKYYHNYNNIIYKNNIYIYNNTNTSDFSDFLSITKTTTKTPPKPNHNRTSANIDKDIEVINVK